MLAHRLYSYLRARLNHLTASHRRYPLQVSPAAVRYVELDYLCHNVSSSLSPTDQNRAKYGALPVCTSPLSALQLRLDSTCLEDSRLRCSTQAARFFPSRPRSGTALHCDGLSLNSSVRYSQAVRSYVGGDWSRTILTKGYPFKAHSNPRCLIRQYCCVRVGAGN
jgi:hypothetical protein